MRDRSEYMRDYMIARYHEKRREAIVSLGGKCVNCGSEEDLEMDHVDPSKKSFSFSKIWSYKPEKYALELAKAQLLCAVCHKDKTIAEKSVGHGEGTSGKKNCKCFPCKQKKREYMQRYNRRGPVA